MAENNNPKPNQNITTSDMENHFETQATNNQVKDALPEFYEFEEKDDYVIGVYLGSRSVKAAANQNEFLIHKIDRGDNVLEFVGGAQIDRVLDDPGMIHKLIKVTYTGIKELGGNKKLKMFTVFHTLPPKGWKPSGE